MQTSPKPKPTVVTVGAVPSKTKPMHKYVYGLVGIFFLFIGSFFFAYSRVANSEEYSGEAFNSLDWQDNQKDNLDYPAP